MKKYIAVFMAVFVAVYVSIAKVSKKDKSQPKVDQLQLASVLINDGYYDRAIEVLKEVDPEQVDKQKFYTLLGFANYKIGNYKEAADMFEKAYSYNSRDKNLLLYIIDSYYKIKDWQKTINWIDTAKDYTEKDPKFYLLKIEAYKNISDYSKLLSTLDEGIEKFETERLMFYRVKFYTLMELKLYSSAMEVAQKLLEEKAVTTDDYVAVAKAFFQNGEYDRAIELLEKAYLLYPEDEKILVSLANNYYKKGMYYWSAYFFEKAAKLDPKYYKDAAEVYRKAGMYQRALDMNTLVVDRDEKLKQRIGILIDMKRCSQVVGLEDIIKASDVYKDDNIKYALAYCLYATDRFNKAESYLKQITQDNVYKKAVQLLQIIDRCKKSPEYCYQEET